jgi:hypothetical protein
MQSYIFLMFYSFVLNSNVDHNSKKQWIFLWNGYFRSFCGKDKIIKTWLIIKKYIVARLYISIAGKSVLYLIVF